MNVKSLLAGLAVLVVGLISSVPAAGQTAQTGPLLGAPEFKPSPERPVGWRGDWTGRFPGATPPLEWSRRVKDVTSELKYQADKPAGEPGADAQALEYFTIKDWLVAGPFAVDNPETDMAKDLLGGEAAVQPAKGAKAGTATWMFLRADVDTQSRHECNGGACAHSNVDFVDAFGKITGEGSGIAALKVEGDFTNKIAYAHTYIHSPADAKVQLQMPFQGVAARFWLNGKPTDLDAKNRGRGVEVTLTKGWNRLLVKVGAAEGLGKGGHWVSQWMVAAYLMPTLPVSYQTKNVAWMTKLPGRSVSQPIVVGDRIFIGSGTSDLLCINKKDGKVLWIQSNTPFDGLPAEAKDAVKEKVEPLAARLTALNAEALAAINAAVSPEGLASKQSAELDQKLKAKEAAEKAIHDALEAIDKKKYSPMYINEVSAGNATACSDGQFVYWACGGGQGWRKAATYVIACFTLDGKRVWTVHDDTLGVMEHGNHTSPALVEGKLIFAANRTVLALDAKTGKELWRNTPNDWTNELCACSPVTVSLGGAAAIVANRYIHRASDGAVVCTSNISDIFCSVVTPIVNDGVLYNAGQQQAGDQRPPTFIAVKLPASAAPGGASAKADMLWAPDGKDVSTLLRGANFMIASPLYVDGIVYTIDMSGGLTALDPAGKKCVFRQWLGGYNRFNRAVYGVCASPTLAGKNVYVVDDAGFTHIFPPGKEFKELGRNVLENIHASGAGGNPCHQESFYTSPCFEGKFMYLRGEEYLYCIGEN
jgi:outer membrane protein assembly factor BamB